jgi:sterol 14-demethylase
MSKLPPALPGLPVLGHIPQFVRDRHALLRRGYKSHGPVFSIRLGPKPVAVLIGPEFQQFFFQETDRALRMDTAYEILAATLGKVAFLASKETYQEQRPILHAPFQREKMIRYVQIMQRVVQEWIDCLGPQGEMEISGEIGRLVQQVAGYTLMGEAFQRSVGSEFWELYGELGKALNPAIPPNWPIPANLRRDRAKKRMAEILQPVIAERRQHPERYDDFLQDFLQTPGRSGEFADDATILGLMRALMFAGHETTAGQAAWTVIEILRSPEYAAMVQAELAQWMPPHSEIDGNLLRSLEHIYWAVREVERLHPSADILMREADMNLEIGGFDIPQGWLVMVSSAVAHRIPELFPQPERFDPLRFAPGREEDRQHRFAMIGFGGGVHKCTGMNFATNEMMVIVALLFSQLEMELITTDTQVQFGLGAVRPSATRVKYRRIASRT